MPRAVTLIRVSMTLVLFSLVIISPKGIVYAQSGLEQPFLGFAWPTHSIPVMIQNVSNPQYARQVILTALSTWNAAQEWFRTNFEQGRGTPYTLYETNISYHSMVNVTFAPIPTADWGYAYYSYIVDGQGHFTSVNSTIVIDTAKAWGQARLWATAMHELGHSLGLGHTNGSYDLMNHFAPGALITYPSTLNLYALYLLSGANSTSTLPPNLVTLPSNIAYGNYLPTQTILGACGTNVTCGVQSNSSMTGPGFSKNTVFIHLWSSFQNLSIYVNLTIPKTAVNDINRVRIFVNNTLPPGSSQSLGMNTTHYSLYFIFSYTFAPNTVVELEVHLAPTSAPTLTYAGLLATVPALLAMAILLKKRVKPDRTTRLARSMKEFSNT